MDFGPNGLRTRPGQQATFALHPDSATFIANPAPLRGPSQTGKGLQNLKSNTMYHHVTQIRICYADVDQMGFVYYGNYPRFYEIARNETIRSLGLSYKGIEDRGIMMPVIEIGIRYKRPAHYDEIISIHTFVREIPKYVKMTFYHEIYNENGELLNEGFATLAFMQAANHHPCRIPEFLKELLSPHFPEQTEQEASKNL